MSEDRELSRLYRAGAREEPSPSLDRAVLDAAAREIRTERRSAGWRAPLALAAALVLAVGLALNMDAELGDAEREGVPAARAPATERNRDAPSALSDSAAPAAQQAATESKSAPNDVGAAAPADSPSRKHAAPAHPESTDGGMAARDTVVPSPSGTVGPPAPSAAPPMPKAQRAEAAESAADAIGRMLEGPADYAVQYRRAAPVPEERGRFANPEQWLREIERLRREGREEEARTLAQAFRREHPDHPLPPELR